MNDLVVEAWERLERLGDALDETRGALSETYRKTMVLFAEKLRE